MTSVSHPVTPLRLVTWLLTAALVLLGGARVAEAQSFDLKEAGWEGTRELVSLAERELGSGRVVSTNRLEWQTLSPADGVLIIHPLGGPDADEISAFLRAGGRVAVVDDFGDGDRLLGRSPYSIKRIPAPRSPLFALRGNPNLPLAEPVTESMAGRRTGVHPVVSEVTRVALNHPMGFSHPDLTNVLRIRASGEPDVSVAVAGQVGKGRLFALGDPSALMNLMLRYPGNRALGLGLVRYLTADDEAMGARGGKLVIVANRFVETGVYGGSSAAERELREWARSVRSDVARTAGEGLPKHVAMGLAVLALGVLLVWVASTSLKVYRGLPPRHARPLPLVAQGGVAGHAAVLSAAGSHRGLTLLEQRDAFEEQAAEILGEPRSVPLLVAAELLERRRALAGDGLARLRRAAALIGKVERAMTHGHPVRVTARDVVAVDRALSVALDALRGYDASSA